MFTASVKMHKCSAYGKVFQVFVLLLCSQGVWCNIYYGKMKQMNCCYVNDSAIPVFIENVIKCC